MNPRSPSRFDAASRALGRVLLGAGLLFAGVAHLTFARVEFRAQVPPFVPFSPDAVVLASGVVELALGAALIALPRFKVAVGFVVAAFFVVIFPGNVSQFVNRVDAFGLDSDRSRGLRLFFQPLLVLWALWCTDAWRAWRAKRS